MTVPHPQAPGPDVPATPETFRALARSSPWLWTDLRFDWTVRDGDESSTLRCEVHRPDESRAVDPDGRVRATREDLRRGFAAYGWGANGAAEPVTRRWAVDTEPPLDAHGLVARSARDFDVHYDAPIIDNYQFVALLDPVELADGQPRSDDDPPVPDGCELTDVHEEPRFGRRTWWATARPLAAYDPRCSCCALLGGQVSDALLATEGGPSIDRDGATVFLVGLDVATGICVAVTSLDRDRAGSGFDVRILAVDTGGPFTIEAPSEHTGEPGARRWRRSVGSRSEST